LFQRKEAKAPTPPGDTPLAERPYEELARLKIAVEEELARRGAEELDVLREKLLTIAAATDVSVGELFGIRERKKKPRKKREPRSVESANGEDAIPA